MALPQSKHDRASPNSKAIINALSYELERLVQGLTRNDGPNNSSFIAPGLRAFAFAYPTIRESHVRVYFNGTLDIAPKRVNAMPILTCRDNLSSPWAKATPYFVVIDEVSQVPPFAEFLIAYSIPLSKAKRGSKQDPKIGFRLTEELTDLEYLEGHATKIMVNRYERDPKAREACIRKHGSSCQCCGMNFKDTYGDKSDGFIHVHHIVQLSKRNTNYKVNPETDLVPLCPNCHAVAHRSDPPLSLEDLKATYKH